MTNTTTSRPQAMIEAAAAAAQLYATNTGSDQAAADVLTDMIADLMHYADQIGSSGRKIDDDARSYYEDEQPQ